MEIELAGSYPILLNRAEAGTLTVAQDGLFWVFDAKCAMQTELVRLSVFGEGGEGYLGIMEPCGDSLVLTKRLSRASLAGFPLTITHAGVHGEAAASVIEAPQKTEIVAVNADDAPLDENKPPSQQRISPPNSFVWRPCPCPCALVSGLAEKAALGSVRGSFFAQDGERTYIAVPVEAASAMPYESIPFLYQTNFDEKNFLICVVADGKIIRRSV